MLKRRASGGTDACHAGSVGPIGHVEHLVKAKPNGIDIVRRWFLQTQFALDHIAAPAGIHHPTPRHGELLVMAQNGDGMFIGAKLDALHAGLIPNFGANVAIFVVKRVSKRPRSI